MSAAPDRRASARRPPTRRLAPMLSDDELLETPLPDLVALAGAKRDEAHGPPGHLLAQGVHPAHHAVPRPLRVLHLRQGAGPARRAVPDARGGARHRPRRAGGRLPRGAVHAGRAPELRYPPARDWLHEHGYASTVDYLADVCALVLEETGLLPHANAGALSRDELAAAAHGVGEPGHDDRVAGRGIWRRTAARPTRTRRAGWPRSRRRASSPSPSRPASSSASARTGRRGWTRCGPSPPPTPATGTCRR